MKPAREYIKSLTIDKSNLQHIANTGVLNGSLLLDLEKAMKEHAREYAQYHVRRAIEEIARHENPDAPQHIFKEDVEYMQKMYPLENIKPCSD